MFVSSAALSPRSRLHWLVVKLCCLLSVLAPFGEGAVAQLIEGTTAPSGVRELLEATESPDDERDLFRVRNRNESWRAERKRSASLHFCLLVDSPNPRAIFFSAGHVPPHHRGPVSEHARRNGCGSPLLC